MVPRCSTRHNPLSAVVVDNHKPLANGRFVPTIRPTRTVRNTVIAISVHVKKKVEASHERTEEDTCIGSFRQWYCAQMAKEFLLPNNYWYHQVVIDIKQQRLSGVLRVD